MIATGLFLLLLGASFATRTEVKYEPNKIQIKEEIDETPILVPNLGAPYTSNYIHHGSNYFIGSPYAVPPGFVAPEETVVVADKTKDCVDASLITKVDNNLVVINEPLPVVSPPQVIEVPKIKLPVPDVSLHIKPLPIPMLPPVEIPIINSQMVPEIPLPFGNINIPGLPFIRNEPMIIEEPRVPVIIEEPKVSVLIEEPKEPCLIEEPKVSVVIQEPTVPLIIEEPKMPVLIEEPVHITIESGEYVEPPSNNHKLVNIPPPPELPPIVVEEVFKTLEVVEEKTVILVPSPGEILPVLPPSAVVISRPSTPLLFAQDIVYERILPNIACEKTKTVELISLPASKRVPVIASSILPFFKK